MNAESKQYKCINCDKKDFKLVFNYSKPDKYEKQIGINFYKKNFSRKIFSCKNCDFHFSNYVFYNNPMEKIYKKNYRSNRLHNPIILLKKIVKLKYKNSETKQRINLIKKYIKNLEDSKIIPIKKKRKLLDVGGASGIFAYEFKDKNWSSSVLDPSIQGKFIKNFGIRYIEKKINNGLKLDKKYDLVTLNYTLEHILKPLETLKIIKKIINKNGFLYIEVPHSISFEKLNQHNDIFNSCHLWFWNPYNISLMLKKLNYEVFLIKSGKEIRGHYSLKIISRPKN